MVNCSLKTSLKNQLFKNARLKTLNNMLRGVNCVRRHQIKINFYEKLSENLSEKDQFVHS